MAVVAARLWIAFRTFGGARGVGSPVAPPVPYPALMRPPVLTRRRFARTLFASAAGMAAGASAWLGASGSASAGPPDPEPPELDGEPSDASARPKILLLGDSMIAGGFGLFLEQGLRDGAGFRVERQGKTSSGLARPDFYDWMERAAAARDRHRPDAVVCMFGGNDGQGLFMGKKADPAWIRYGEPGWFPEYRRRVAQFADIARAEGAALFWIGMPPMGPEKLNERVRAMNVVFRGEMAVRQRAWFVDIWPLLADEDGAFATHRELEGQRTRVRAHDGVHLNRVGATYLAQQVIP